MTSNSCGWGFCRIFNRLHRSFSLLIVFSWGLAMTTLSILARFLVDSLWVTMIRFSFLYTFSAILALSMSELHDSGSYHSYRSWRNISPKTFQYLPSLTRAALDLSQKAVQETSQHPARRALPQDPFPPTPSTPNFSNYGVFISQSCDLRIASNNKTSSVISLSLDSLQISRHSSYWCV